MSDLSQIDLTTCDREPIHIPGSIQPHGFLIAVDKEDLIVHISANLPGALNSSAEKVLDQSCASVFGFSAQNAAEIFEIGGSHYDVSIRPAGQITIVEFEPHGVISSDALMRSLQDFDASESVRDLGEKATQSIKHLCGFDRVMLYRFLPDDSGEVIAEAVGPGIESYLGLHYPASDIPKQARQLYILNRSRLVADVSYVPVRLISSQISPIAADPLDMSHCSLRSVSPIHVQYLKNMRVAASMSISLIRNGALWGLIACHHSKPWYGSKQMREACEVLGSVISVQIGALEDRREAQHLRRGQEVLKTISERFTEDGDFFSGLVKSESELLDLVHATGAAVIRDGRCHLLGATPSTTEIMRLSQWVGDRSGRSTYKTNRLAEDVPEARRYVSVASGMLAISPTTLGEDHVMWFRPEIVETITWAGDPNKPLDDGNELRPRSSFQLWKEEVRQRSQPWTVAEATLAHQLRVAILENELKSMHSQLEARVAVRTSELQKAVDELNGFTYSVSHDLRTPLRGMVGNSRIILEEYSEQLSPSVKTKLRSIEANALKMANLVDDLLSFARLGRKELKKSPVDLSGLARKCAERLSAQGWPCAELQFEVQDGLMVLADPDQVEILLTILIENGCKYRTEDQQARVWITAEMNHGQTVFEVKNVGIGFENHYADRLFKPFERLHREQDYPGTGIGLANAKRIVERHGGSIWAEGRPDEGASFYFTI